VDAKINSRKNSGKIKTTGVSFLDTDAHLCIQQQYDDSTTNLFVKDKKRLSR
jgi:hypothetical protein